MAQVLENIALYIQQKSLKLRHNSVLLWNNSLDNNQHFPFPLLRTIFYWQAADSVVSENICKKIKANILWRVLGSSVAVLTCFSSLPRWWGMFYTASCWPPPLLQTKGSTRRRKANIRLNSPHTFKTNFSILTIYNLQFWILLIFQIIFERFVFVMSCMFVYGGQQRRYDGDPAEHKMASGFDAILLQRPSPNISHWKP